MATISAVWVPTENGSSSSLVGPGGDSGAIRIGKRQLFRIWTDNPSGLSINFGDATVSAPTSSSYSIGTVPQDFDMGDLYSYLRLVNNSSISSANYYILGLSKF